MKGFDAEFEDLEDYILTITARIWEGRDVGAIRRYYAPGCIVRTPMGVTTGPEPIVAGTLETLHAFPDRRLLSEDVIASGDEDAGFYSSHRIVSPMRHRGDGAFGAATGRHVRARTIADCVVRANQVQEEWLVRDQAAIVRQIGADPRVFAAEALAREVEAGRTPVVFTPAVDVAGEYRVPAGPTDNLLDEAARYGDLLQSLWCERDLSVVNDVYDEAVSLELPAGESASGRAGADRFWLGYLAAFPDAQLSVEHLIGRADPGRAVRVAARWSVQATHSGRGAFGAPTGANVYVMAISHAEIVGGRVIREWTLVDELAIWRQIAMATG